MKTQREQEARLAPDPEGPLGRLLAGWRDDAEVLRRRGHPDAAERLERHAEEVEQALRAQRLQAITVAEAATESGYSEDHLRELARQGKIEALRPNGPRGTILLPRYALPRKPLPPPSDSEAGNEEGAVEESPAERAFRRSQAQRRR